MGDFVASSKNIMFENITDHSTNIFNEKLGREHQQPHQHETGNEYGCEKRDWGKIYSVSICT